MRGPLCKHPEGKVCVFCTSMTSVLGVDLREHCKHSEDEVCLLCAPPTPFDGVVDSTHPLYRAHQLQALRHELLLRTASAALAGGWEPGALVSWANSVAELIVGVNQAEVAAAKDVARRRR